MTQTRGDAPSEPACAKQRSSTSSKMKPAKTMFKENNSHTNVVKVCKK